MWASSVVLLYALLMVAMASAQHAAFYYADDDISHFAGERMRLATVRLYLPYEPRLRVMTLGANSAIKLPPRQVTLAEVRQVLTTHGWQDASGAVLLQVREAVDDLHAGQTIEIVGELDRPGVAMNPGQFDWRTYYRQQRILTSVHVRHASGVRILQRESPPVLTRWREFVRGAMSSGFTEAQNLDRSLVTALVLGDYDPELRDLREQFRATGTSHHLAISGMHIATVGGFVFVVLRLLRFSPRSCWLTALLVVTAYGIVATPSPPVVRSVLLFLAAAGGFLLRRSASPVQLLSVTVLLMLVCFPLDLYNAGFQLSFGTVLGLMLLSQPLMTQLTRNHPILTHVEKELLPLHRKAARWIDAGALQVMSTGVIAWLVSMPLIAMHFSQLNPWQVIASIALAPVVTTTLIAGVLKVALTMLLPFAAPTLAELAATSSSWMRSLLGYLAQMPMGDVPLPAPSVWLMILCWTTLLLACIPWRTPGALWYSRLAMLAAFAWMVFGPYLSTRHGQQLEGGSLRMTVLAVGAGQCVIVEPPGGKVTLFDAGSNSVFDLDSKVVAPALRQLGHTRIDTIFVSHANTDHYSGVAELVDAYGVSNVLVGEHFDRICAYTESGQQLLEQLRLLQRPPKALKVGEHIPLGGDTFVDVVWPDRATRTDANNSSSVLRLTHAGRSVLLPGDIQQVALEQLASDPQALSSSVLIAPHHGSLEDATARFLSAVDPQLIISSNDRTLTMKQRDFDRVTASRRLLRTHRSGAVTVVIDRDGKLAVSSYLAP
jgi:competence protein ComEC